MDGGMPTIAVTVQIWSILIKNLFILLESIKSDLVNGCAGAGVHFKFFWPLHDELLVVISCYYSRTSLW